MTFDETTEAGKKTGEGLDVRRTLTRTRSVAIVVMSRQVVYAPLRVIGEARISLFFLNLYSFHRRLSIHNGPLRPR